ncbi:MAG: phage holin family protein [Bacilli bacterium]|nr:phage holin family protein [Bacilli bacterium]
MYKILDYLVHTIGYALVLIVASLIFPKTFYIDNSYYGLWPFIAAIIISILNKTIKPILVWLTLPLTAITLGLFYPVINVLILNIVEFVLDKHFIINGIFMSIVVAIVISILNYFLKEFIIRPITGGKYE